MCCHHTLPVRFPICVLALAFAVSSCTRAKEDGKAQAGNSPAHPTEGASGSVWVVESPNGGRLYLCGTIHILRDSDYPLAPAYEAAYADSGRLVFELPPGSGGAAMVNRMRELGTLPEGETLRGIAGDKVWEQIGQWAGRAGMSAGTFTTFRPWFAALMITAVEYGRLGAQPEKGVDSYFEERAARDKKPGEGLEDVEFQLQLFSKLSAKHQQELLEQTLAEVRTLGEEFEKMITAWKAGDLETLGHMLYHEAEKYPELMDLFLHDRNKAWIGKLESFLKNGEKVMVLVGTGHFAGKLGVIELLRERGYTVKRYGETAKPR
jgi:uncharacterized protein